MPWKEVSVTDERVKFVMDYERQVLSGEKSMSALCLEHGIARKTGYKMLSRRDEEGWPGLADRSRAPHSGKHWSAADVIMRVLEVRLRFPHWGADTILTHLQRENPDVSWPGIGAAHRWIKRAGLINKSVRARRFSPSWTANCEPTHRAERRVGHRLQRTLSNQGWALLLSTDHRRPV